MPTFAATLGRIRPRLALAFPVFLWGRRRWVRFDGDFHLGTWLKTHLVSILVRQRVLDAKLSIEVIGALHGDLGLFRFARVYGFNDLFNSCRQSGAWFFAHRWLLIAGIRHGPRRVYLLPHPDVTLASVRYRRSSQHSHAHLYDRNPDQSVVLIPSP